MPPATILNASQYYKLPAHHLPAINNCCDYSAVRYLSHQVPQLGNYSYCSAPLCHSAFSSVRIPYYL